LNEYQIEIAGKTHRITIKRREANHFLVSLDGHDLRVSCEGLPSFGRNLTFRINSVPHQVSLSRPSPDGKINVAIQGQHFEAYLTAAQQGRQQPCPENREELIQHHVGTKIVLAPMSGRIMSLVVRTGQRVHAGQALVILEAMKMENEIISPWDGTIDKIHVAEGAEVRKNEPIISLA
jgi:biotin carboxyl carrier protein